MSVISQIHMSQTGHCSTKLLLPEWKPSPGEICRLVFKSRTLCGVGKIAFRAFSPKCLSVGLSVNFIKNECVCYAKVVIAINNA